MLSFNVQLQVVVQDQFSPPAVAPQSVEVSAGFAVLLAAAQSPVSAPQSVEVGAPKLVVVAVVVAVVVSADHCKKRT